jgi:hypothetical protein
MDKWLKDILPDKDPYHNRGRDQMRKKGGSGIRVPVIFTCFTYSKGLKCSTVLIIETYTLACPIFKISQFIIYKPSNSIYNYQGEQSGTLFIDIYLKRIDLHK